MFFSRKEDFVVEMKHCLFRVPATCCKEYPTLTNTPIYITFLCMTVHSKRNVPFAKGTFC